MTREIRSTKFKTKNVLSFVIWVLILNCHLNFVICHSAYAIGDATQCLVTVKKVLLKNLDGEWVLLLNEDRELNLAKEDSYIEVVNDKVIPTGAYTGCKIILSETLKVAGSDGPDMTKEGGEVWVEGVASKLSELPGEISMLRETTPTWNTEKAGLITVHLNLDFSDRDDIMEIFTKTSFPKPVKIREGSKIQIFLSIVPAKTIRYVWADFWEKFPKHDTMYFLPPARVDELSVKVDGITALATNDIEWTF